MTFKIGDMVTWISQSNGSYTEKVGEVVAVIPAHEYPRRIICKDHLLESKYNIYSNDVLAALPRNHESYILAVPTPKCKGKPRIYWPRVSGLRLTP